MPHKIKIYPINSFLRTIHFKWRCLFEDKKEYILTSFILILIFFISRGWYFFLSDYALGSLAYDSTWWLGAENIIGNKEFLKDNYLKTRIEVRSPIESVIHQLILFFSKFSGYSHISVNLFFTSIIYFFSIIALFYLGKKVLNSLWLGLLYAFFCIQSPYSIWLSYPVFVPKMIGFAFYPIILLALTNPEERITKWSLFLLTLYLILYPVSLIYTLPSIILGLWIYYYIYEYDHIKIKLNFLFNGLLWLSIAFLSCFIISCFTVHYPAAKKEIMSLFYPMPLSLSHIMLTYSLYFVYIIIFILLFYMDQIFNLIKEKRIYLYMIISISFIFFSFMSYLLQNYISLLRANWFWRCVFYSNVPSILFFFLFTKEAMATIFKKWQENKKNLNKGFSLPVRKILLGLLPLILLLPLLNFWEWTFLIRDFSSDSLSFYRAVKSISSLTKNKDGDIENDFSKIMKVINKLPKGTCLLLPPLDYQTRFTDLIEARSPHVCLLSRADSYHYIFHTHLTDSYIKNNLEYKQIVQDAANPNILSKKLLSFMRKLNVQVILVPNQIKLDPFFFNTLYSGLDLRLYIIKSSVRSSF